MPKKNIKSFMMGVIVTLIAVAMITPVSAATSAALKNIQVTMGGIKIYVDGNVQIPVDGKGNRVEPLIYNGTTYLPVRALTQMLTDKEISWDQKSMSVYLGKQPVASSTPLDQLTPYETYYLTMITGENSMFNILDETIRTFNLLKNSEHAYSIYMLKSQYSSINGKFVVPNTNIGNTLKSKLEFYSIDEYGTESLIDSYELKSGDKAVDVSVNTIGVDIIKIKFAYPSHTGAFYNITLTGL